VSGSGFGLGDVRKLTSGICGRGIQPLAQLHPPPDPVYPLLDPEVCLLRFTLITVALAIAFGAGPAYSAEAETSVVLGARYHMVDLAARAPVHLGGITAGMEWGLSDFWNLQATLSGAGGGTATGIPAAGGTVGLQIATLIDATQWVPYIAAGVRGGLLDLDVDTRIDAYFELYGGGGVDYRPARGWSIGLFGFGGMTWSGPGIGASAGGLFTFKMYVPHFFE